MDEFTIVTNHVPRVVIDASELSSAESREFDYLDWEAIEEGRDSASFFRYRGSLYDLGDFLWTGELREGHPLREWHGYISDSFFSGMVIRFSEDYESVIVGRYFS